MILCTIPRTSNIVISRSSSYKARVVQYSAPHSKGLNAEGNDTMEKSGYPGIMISQYRLKFCYWDIPGYDTPFYQDHDT